MTPGTPSADEALPEALMELALRALDHAMGSVEDSGGPLVPFSMVVIDGGIALSRFVGELEVAQQHAREQVRGTREAQRAAVAWDGYLTSMYPDGSFTPDGHRTDAVFVEASERGGARSVILAQRYERVGRISDEGVGRISYEKVGRISYVKVGRVRKHMRPLGNPAVVAYAQPLF